MALLKILQVLFGIGMCSSAFLVRAQEQQFFDSDISTTTPVPIINFIDKLNEDGSYTYGYENGDGSYKIETKSANGEVRGKYGYIDSFGNLREVQYGATSEKGFEPTIDGSKVTSPLDFKSQLTAARQEPTTKPLSSFFQKSSQPQFSSIQQQRPQHRSKFNSFRQEQSRPGFNSFPQENFQVSSFQQPQPRADFEANLSQSTEAVQRPGFKVVKRRKPKPLVHQEPISLAVPVAQSPLFGLHPARNINLQDGSYTLQYVG